MVDNQKTLGRGLGSLIPKKDSANSDIRRPVSGASYFPKTQSGVSNQILHVSPAKIKLNPYQPRQQFTDGSLSDLKNSIKQHGILQPLIVTQTMGGTYELIAGERRLRSARELNLASVPVIVRTAKDLEKLELSLIENIQRHDLNPIEKAAAYKQLLDNFHLTQEEASKRLGIARSTLNNTLRLLHLPVDIQTALASGKISESQAKLILSLSDAQAQHKVFKQATTDGATVQDTQRQVRQIKVKSHTRSTKKDPRLTNWEDSLATALGTRVKITKRGQQGGVVEIEYYSDEELQGIVENITQG